LHLKGQLKLEAEGVPVARFAPHDFAGLFSTIQRLGALPQADPDVYVI